MANDEIRGAVALAGNDDVGVVRVPRHLADDAQVLHLVVRFPWCVCGCANVQFVVVIVVLWVWV